MMGAYEHASCVGLPEIVMNTNDEESLKTLKSISEYFKKEKEFHYLAKNFTDILSILNIVSISSLVFSLAYILSYFNIKSHFGFRICPNTRALILKLNPKIILSVFIHYHLLLQMAVGHTRREEWGIETN